MKNILMAAGDDDGSNEPSNSQRLNFNKAKNEPIREHLLGGGGSRLAYDLREVAAALGVSIPTVRRLIQRGFLKVLPHVRHKLVIASSLRRFIQEGNNA